MTKGKTRHIQARMSQRGIKQAMIELVARFGKPSGDKKVILNRKGIDSALQELEKMKKNMLKMRESGGICLIEDNGILITTYPMGSYKRCK